MAVEQAPALGSQYVGHTITKTQFGRMLVLLRESPRADDAALGEALHREWIEATRTSASFRLDMPWGQR